MILTTEQAINRLDVAGVVGTFDYREEAWQLLLTGRDARGIAYDEPGRRARAAEILRAGAPTDNRHPDWWVWDVVEGLGPPVPAAETEAGLFGGSAP